MKQLFNRLDAHARVELLSAYLDNQVSPAERARLESHLRDCAACRAELASLRQTVAVMRALPRVPVPHAFTLSEAKIGVRQPAPKAAWLGGLVRGLGAVTAVALVAVVAVTVLRPPAAAPEQAVARSAPTAAVVEKAVEAPLALAPAAPAPMAVQEAPVASVQVPTTQETGAETPSLAMAQDTAAVEPAQPEAAATAALAAAPAARTIAPTETAEPAMLAMAPPAPSAPETTTAPSAKAAGTEGGADAAAALAPARTMPEPTPPLASVTDVLSDSARVVYADLAALWAIDRASGVRPLAAAEGLHMPLIAPDGSYVVYRVPRQDYMALWGVPWDGDAPKLLLDEQELPKEGLDAEYTQRRIKDVQWIPGRLALALNIARKLSPDATETSPQVELWELDVETGALHLLAPLGRSYRPFYAPDGSQFALLEYGTEADPQGQLTLFAADGSDARTALSFSASPAKLSYDDQIAWLPDSSALWLAIPAADSPGPGQFNGTTLYRIDAAGQAQEAGFVDAYQVAWSPDGTRLAYLRSTSDMMADGELYLADANGAGAQLYATVKNGAFVAWSPDATHFLYQDDSQMVLGAVGQLPQRQGAAASFVNPRWVSDTQFVSLHDTGTGWLLTLRGLDGRAAGLLPLPREAMVDVNRP